MSVQFLTKKPTPREVERFRLAISTFRDGSGQEKAKDGTRSGWRDYERIVAELFGVDPPENKEVFDAIVPDKAKAKTDYGISVKSKQLGKPKKILELSGNGRVYMEVTNPAAKFWFALQQKGISERDFRGKKKPRLIGETILNTVHSWHLEAKRKHEEQYKRSLDLNASVYFVISYSEPSDESERLFQIHTFNLSFPSGIIWRYKTERCLSGYDPKAPDEALIDWYAFSGAQLKYYPKAKESRFSSPVFKLALPPKMTIVDKVKQYWPDQWKKNFSGS